MGIGPCGISGRSSAPYAVKGLKIRALFEANGVDLQRKERIVFSFGMGVAMTV